MKSSMKHFICIAYVLTAPIASHADPVDDYIKTQMHQNTQQIPGLSLEVIKNGRVVKSQGYGLENLEVKTPATPDTVYKLASLSKQFVAAGIMLLVQDGKLGLDDKLSKYIDSTPDSWKDITVLELLCHTSGIIREAPIFDPTLDQADIDVIKSAYTVPLDFKPGDKWQYSNTDYYCLAQIITNVTGEPWTQFIQDRIFTPEHMTSTRAVSVSDIIPNRASGYTVNDTGTCNADIWYALRPSGGFMSSVKDMAIWDQVLDSNSLLSQSSKTAMWTPAIINDGSSTTYGFGWYVDTYDGHRRIHHGGGVPGFVSDFEKFPDEKLTVIVLANNGSADLPSIALTVASLYDPSLPAPPAFLFTANQKLISAKQGQKITIKLTAQDTGGVGEGVVIDLETRDSDGKKVDQQPNLHESFVHNQIKTYTYTWTPTEPGKYVFDAGAFTPDWKQSYKWDNDLVTINVE